MSAVPVTRDPGPYLYCHIGGKGRTISDVRGFSVRAIRATVVIRRKAVSTFAYSHREEKAKRLPYIVVVS